MNNPIKTEYEKLVIKRLQEDLDEITRRLCIVDTNIAQLVDKHDVSREKIDQALEHKVAMLRNVLDNLGD